MTSEAERERRNGPSQRRLAVYSLGFLRRPALRRALADAGWAVAPPGAAKADAVGVWGRSGVSRRGEAAAARFGKPLLVIEDGFLRSVRPGGGAPVLSLILDDVGVYYDAGRPSRLEQMIETEAPANEDRACAALARLRALRLSKYNAAAEMAARPAGHVLVIDQTRGDASIAYGDADGAAFERMLAAAKTDHPTREILIKTHPETAMGRKAGHLSAAHAGGRVRLVSDGANPWDLIDGAAAVYAVTSQMGFEAVLAGKSVRLFGSPFYAGWGKTEDERGRIARRTARPSVEALFDAAYLRYPTYFDPFDGGLSDFETAIETLALWRDAAREAAKPTVFVGMRLWKRAHATRFVENAAPGSAAAAFADDPTRAATLAAKRGGRCAVWAGRETDALRAATQAASVPLVRVEDGFLRSVGLGAALAPPLSLVFDDLGIYFDPRRESRLERLIAAACDDSCAERRAAALRRALVDQRVTKYNLESRAPPLERPTGKRVILAPGQVADDASILRGAGRIADNLSLLRATRAAAPDAHIVYKPHPDVEAGLRDGAVSEAEALAYADVVAADVTADAALEIADEVWTITSLLGFEALLRGKRVSTFGAPFYAGWGLTKDYGETPARRVARPTLDQLVHAALIDYPIYLDPVSGLRCGPETIVKRLSAGVQAGGPAGRLLSKAQGLAASWAWLWR